jgi:hypothetical protein
MKGARARHDRPLRSVLRRREPASKPLEPNERNTRLAPGGLET